MATIVRGDFEWDSAKAAANRLKHGVSFDEATTVFDDPRALAMPDLVHEDRGILIGHSQLRRTLFVVMIEAASRIRILSARIATAGQRRRYEEGED